MYIYLFFIILGILLYILLNNYNTFSIGIPTSYNIHSLDPRFTYMVPGPEEEQTFTADTDNPEDATNVSGQTLQEYITTQIQVFGDQAFPGGPQNYVLVPIDSPEVDEPPEISEGELKLDSTSNEYYRQRLKSFGISDRDINGLIDMTSSQKKKLSLACASLSNDQSLFTRFIRDSQLYESIAQHINSENISLMDIINILEITKTNYQTLSREDGISLDNIYDIFLRLIVGLLMKGYNVEQISNYISTIFDSTFLNDFFEPYNSNNNDMILRALLEKFLEDNN